AGIYPDYWSLFKRNPRHWFTAFFSPYNGATYRLNEPEHEEKAIQTMKSHKVATLGFFQYFLILFLRFFLFDFWLNSLSDVKYWIQTSSWWPAVRSCRVVIALNYLWMAPKHAIFDNKSDDKQESRSSYWRARIDSSSQSHFEVDNVNGKSRLFKCENLSHRKG
ncbi:MAG: hypothetical protein MJE68_31550, partial [Proteobacteria bacterium]|nr:hypothetical protein [Pseudomonadota bacterium]